MSGVLVILQQQTRNGRSACTRMSWEALAAGQELAARANQPLLAAVAGGAAAGLSSEFQQKRVDRAYVEHPALEHYTADGYVTAYEQLIRELDPSFVLFPHTYRVRDFAPRLAARFQQSLIADVIGHRFEGRAPVFVRQLLQGKLNADYTHVGGGPCFVSVQGGAYHAETLASGSSEAEIFTLWLESSQIRSKPGEPFRMGEQTVDLTAAPVIVSVGRGIQEKENIPLVADLARAMEAELAASRPICDSGWPPMERGA